MTTMANENEIWIFSNSELDKTLILKDFMHVLVARPTTSSIYANDS